MLIAGEEGSVLANPLNRVRTYRVTANILFCTCTINLAYPGANTELHLLLSLITQWLIILHSAIFFLSWIFKRTFLAEFVFKWFWVCSLPRSFLSRSLSSFSSFNLSPLHFSAVPLLSWFLKYYDDVNKTYNLAHGGVLLVGMVIFRLTSPEFESKLFHDNTPFQKFW